MEKLVVWGRNPVIEALKAGRSLEKILVAHDSRPPKELLELAKRKGVKVQRVPRRRVEELAGTKKTQGVVALLSPVFLRPSRRALQEDPLGGELLFSLGPHHGPPERGKPS